MFEDSIFESTGRIHTRSRCWMMATLALNGTVLGTLILIPLIYPDALPRQPVTFLLEAPPAPTAPELPKLQPTQTSPTRSELTPTGGIQAPSRIPKYILEVGKPETLPTTNVAELGGDSTNSVGAADVFNGQRARTIVRQEAAGPVRLPSTVVSALLIYKNVPAYPAIPKAVGIQGTVVLQATISRAGTIDNLRAVSGPPMLQQAALDAVRTWRYRPYLLNGQPVEVDTTVNVIFTLGR